MLCADETTTYLSFVFCTIASTDSHFQKGGKLVWEGSTFLPPNGFLTKALFVLVNPKQKKFTHWQLKYSPQKRTWRCRRHWVPSPLGWAHSVLLHLRHGPAAMDVLGSLAQGTCLGYRLSDWKISTFSFVSWG